jgi:hypothetical protein
MALRSYTNDKKVEEIREVALKKFEEEFKTLPSDVQKVMYRLFSEMFAGTPSRWSKTAKTQFRGSRIQLGSALPVLQILSSSIKVQELIGLSTEYAPDTFYVIWETDDFVVPLDLKKLNEIISTRADCETGRS